MERWKAVPGYVSLYKVSTDGRVASLGRWSNGRNGATPFRPGRVLKPCVKANGYHCVTLVDANGIKRQFSIHRLVLLAFRGPPPEGAVTRHRNGDRSDNRLANVLYGTQQENADDKRRHGTVLYGVKHPRAKITEAQVRRIRRAKNMAQVAKLAIAFGITYNHGWAVFTGKTWKHL